MFYGLDCDGEGDGEVGGDGEGDVECGVFGKWIDVIKLLVVDVFEFVGVL